MLKKAIFNVFTIIVFIASFQILGTLILARNLTKPEFGIYRLILTIVELGSFIALIGIDHSLVRFFSSAEISFKEYNWKGFLKKFSLFSLLLIFIITYIVAIIYKFSPFINICIIVLLYMTLTIFMLSSLLRAQKKYALSIFLARQHFLIFFLCLLMLYIFKNISVTNLLICHIIASTLSNFILILYSLKNVPSGNTPIPFSVLKNGFYFFGIGVSLMITLKASYLFIGKMLSYKDIAIYAVIASTMRLFEFEQDASYYVLVPHLNTKKHISFKRVLGLLLSIGLVTALIYILFGKTIVHLFFKGLYDTGIYLIPLFIAIGFIRLIYVLPASIISGRGSEDILRKYFYFTMLFSIINIGLFYVFIPKWGLKGAAIASAVTWAMLLITGSLLTKKHYINE